MIDGAALASCNNFSGSYLLATSWKGKVIEKLPLYQRFSTLAVYPNKLESFKNIPVPRLHPRSTESKSLRVGARHQ